MMTLMLWMRDSRGIHNQRPDPTQDDLLCTRTAVRGPTADIADIATLQSILDVAACVETLLSMFCLHVPTCAVWADDSCTLLLLTSLGKWAVPVNLQDLQPRYLFIIFSGLKSVCCQLSQLLWPSFQNNTFNSCMSLIIHSRVFFGKLLESSYMR